MNIRINGKNIKITAAMKESVEQKLQVLDKFIGDENVSVIVTSRKRDQLVSVRFVYDSKFVEVTKNGEEFYCLVDEIVDILKVKLEKLHSQKVKRQIDQEKALQALGSSFFDDEDSEDEYQPVIAKYKKFVLKPMFEAEAIYQMEALGHTSYIFKNANKDDVICMVYRRSDGKYGLIETE
jgi:putative sigma-54 modulation protein